MRARLHSCPVVHKRARTGARAQGGVCGPLPPPEAICVMDRYDAETGKTKGGNTAAPALVTLSGIIGAGLLAALVGLGLLS